MLKMIALQVLAQARGLILTGWSKGAFSRDADMDQVELFDEEACCFCMAGAMFKVAKVEPLKAPAGFLDELARLLGFEDQNHMMVWNDRPERTKNQVLRCFDQAISNLG